MLDFRSYHGSCAPFNSGVKLLRVVERDLERFKLKRQATVTSVVKSSATARVHRLAKRSSGKIKTAAPHPNAARRSRLGKGSPLLGANPCRSLRMRGPPSPQHPLEDLATLAASCLFLTTCAWPHSRRRETHNSFTGTSQTKSEVVAHTCAHDFEKRSGNTCSGHSRINSHF
jgi:hypothetical protein